MIPGPESLVSHTFLIERMRVHAHFYLSNYPMLRDTCTIQETMEYFDRDMQRVFGLFADMAKGETIDESRVVEHSVTIQVFASWADHLKYRLKVGRLAWLPERIKRKIAVRYAPLIKTEKYSVPVRVTRACPHVNQDWGKNPSLHVAFLKPTEWVKSGLPLLLVMICRAAGRG